MHIFTYDRLAEREIGRFILTGLGQGLIIGALWGVLSSLTHSALWSAIVLAVVLFIALFTNVTVAKTLYWSLAILLQAAGLVLFGVPGAIVGLLLWFAALLIVPALRYVLQPDNVMSVSVSAVLTWLTCLPIFHLALFGPSHSFQTGVASLAFLGLYVGGVFWGIAKIISSGFKEYRFRSTRQSSGANTPR